MGLDYSKKEIADGTDISIITMNKFWDELGENGTVVKTRKYGNVQLYKLNEKNDFVKKLIELDKSLITSAKKIEVEA